MWTRVVRVAIAGIVLTGAVVAVGVVDAEASFPGNNGRLVYAEDKEVEPFGSSVSEIYTMEPNGTNVRQLTSDAGQQPIVHTGDYWLTSNYSPAWAPSGDVIAYVHLGVRYTTSIRLIDPDGRFVGTVTDDFRLHTSPAYSPLLSWSPDGDRLAFSGSQTNGGPEDLWTIRIDGTDPQRVVVDSGSSRGLYHIRDVSWSPRGDLIAFSARNVEHGRAAVHVVAPDGSNLRMIDCGINFGIETEWSPNGRLLYCSESSMGTVWATTMPQGSSTFPAVSFAGDRAQPTASPDGLQLLHVSDYALWSDNPKSRIEAFSGGHLDWQPIQGSFWDDETSVFVNDIEWMAHAGITKGCNPPTNDKYCPANNVTRGQMAAFLVRALDLTDDGGGNIFTDDDESVFEGEIERLAAAGITKGCNPPMNDRYCPEGKVTRGQMAAFLVRALGYTDNGGGNLFIDDDDSIFEGDIDRLGTARVTKGCNPPTNDRYCPRGNVTRGQMAAFLHRALS